MYVVSNLIYEAFEKTAAAPDLDPASRRNDGASLLSWILGEVRTAVKYAALALSARTDGEEESLVLCLSYVLTVIFLTRRPAGGGAAESAARGDAALRGQEVAHHHLPGKSFCHLLVFAVLTISVSLHLPLLAQMYGDILMFLPPTAGNKRRMGIDFEIPISQVECVRKDIQCFLILRTLFKHVAELSKFTKNVSTTGEQFAAWPTLSVLMKVMGCAQRTYARPSRTRTSSASARPTSCPPPSLTVSAMTCLCSGVHC